MSDSFRSGWAWGAGLPRVGVGEGRVAPGRQELNRDRAGTVAWAGRGWSREKGEATGRVGEPPVSLRHESPQVPE